MWGSGCEFICKQKVLGLVNGRKLGTCLLVKHFPHLWIKNSEALLDHKGA